MSARYAAYKLIEKVETGGYSNIALGGMFSKSDSLSDRDKAFAARLFYGVTERKLTLEHIIGAYVSKPLQKLDRQVRITLMMGVYQIMYMDNVPDSAAVNESVSLVKKLGKASASGMVNAVLRSIIRDGKKIPPVKGDKYDKMAVEYSCPAELIRRICKGYGEENTVSLLEASLLPSVTVLRTNVLKTSSEELIASLKSRGISAQASEFEENAVICDDLRDVERDPDFIAGNYHVQDYSSQLCCKAVSPRKGETVIDICAAPGGKSTLLASQLPDGSLLVSNEVIRSRAVILKENLIKWGRDHVVITQNDPADFKKLNQAFDLILVDAPCSGEGMFRKDREAIEEWSEANLHLCRERQKRIISDIWDSLKPGGYFIYSTCTYNPEENERIVEWIQEKWGAESIKIEHPFPEITAAENPLYGYRFYPHKVEGEGFFISVLRKNEASGGGGWKAKKTRLSSPLRLPEELTALLPDVATLAIRNEDSRILILPASHPLTISSGDL